MENESFPVAWTPPNARNKATVFRLIFSKYTNTRYPVSKHARERDFEYITTEEINICMITNFIVRG